MFDSELMDQAERLLERCRAAGVMLATAESCTGGLVSALLTAVNGSSAVVERGFVTYTNTAKNELLGVPDRLLMVHGAVSEEVARAMAEGALARAPVHLAVSITGIAGPGGGTDAKPVGLVHFGCARSHAPTLHVERRFGEIGRNAVRRASVKQALDLLAEGLDP